MTGMDAELVKKEMIGAFDLILKLDRKPEMLAKLPRSSIIVDRGRRKMIVPAKKGARILLL